MSKYNFTCKLCRDNGREGGCPNCGRLPQLKAQSVVQELTLSELKSVHVPPHYVKNPWNSLILEEDKSEYCDDPTFRRYVTELTKVYNHLKSGGSLNNSAIVCSPLGYGKTTWAYNCILELLKHDFNICPIIDTSQLKSMQTLYYEKPAWRNTWNGYSYIDYIESDVLFLSVTKSPEYVYASRLIIDIVDARSKLSKPTVVLSDWPIGQLLDTDKTGMLKSMLFGGTNANPFKYLINISFTDYIKTN